MKYLLAGTVLVLSSSLVLAQTSGPTAAPEGRLTTLIISPNANGNGVQVLDQNRQVVGANGAQVDGQGEQVDEDDLNDQVVLGLIDWLEKWKKKKRDKKERKDREKGRDEVRPHPPPTPPPHNKPEEEKKEIHIHIHIKKKDEHQGHNKHGYGDYHEGHQDHDKHFQGKHSWPLLGHHYNWDQDFFGGGVGGSNDPASGGGGNFGSGDYDGGFDTQSKVNNYVIEKKPIVVQRPVLVKKEP